MIRFRAGSGGMTDKLLVIIGITTLCMLSPGPDMLLVMRNTLTRGRRFGAVTSLGVLTGNLVHIGYCVLGIAWVISQSHVAYSVLRYASAAYLIYLGISGLRASGSSEIEAEQTRVDRSAYLQGLINNLLNPKGSLFYLGVFSQLITPDLPPMSRWMLVVAMMSVSALFWIGFVQTMNWPAVRMRLLRSHAIVDRAFGVVLILLGARAAFA